MQAWEKAVNDAGGINGSPVDVIIKDDGADPAKALQSAKELVEGEHVIAIVGEISLADAAFADYVHQKGIPVVGGAAPEPIMSTSPDFFPSGATLPALITGTLAQAEGKKKLATLYCAESPVCAQLVPLAQGIGGLYGLDVAAAKVSGTQPNYTATCLQMKDQGADAMYIAAGGPVVQKIIADCAKQNYKPVNVVQCSTTTNTMIKDPALDGALIACSNANAYDSSTPAVKDFQDALEAYAPGTLEDPGFAYDAFYPWTGGKLFEAAAKAGNVKAGSTAADVKKGLYALKDDTLDGLAPPLTYTEGKPFFSPCWFTGKIEGGKYVSENSNKVTCLDAAKTQELQKVLGG
jgi:branched-chain amino acid transport system substrate-binding protein